MTLAPTPDSSRKPPPSPPVPPLCEDDPDYYEEGWYCTDWEGYACTNGGDGDTGNR